MTSRQGARSRLDPALQPLALLVTLLLVSLGCNQERDGVEAPHEKRAEQASTAPRLETLASGTTERLQAVAIGPDGRALLGGLGGTWGLLEGGANTLEATAMEGFSELQFRDVALLSQGRLSLLAAGEGRASAIFSSHDHGASWTRVLQPEDPRAFWDCFAFWSDGRGVLFGDSIDGRFDIRTTRDGETWQTLAPQPGSLPEASSGEGGFAASGTCVAVAPGGLAWIVTGAAEIARVLRSRDYGASWQAFETPLAMPSAASGLMSIAIRHAATGPRGGLELWAAGGDLENADDRSARVLTSHDLGETWQATATPTFSGAVYGLAADDASPRLLAVGPGGVDLSTNGGASWHAVTREAIWSAAWQADGSAILVGPEGRVLRAHDLR